MKRFLKRLGCYTLGMFILISCGNAWKAKQDDVVMGSVMKAQTYIYTDWQVDSMCRADNLPLGDNGWIVKKFYDYETGENVIKKMYIKEIEEDNEMVYIVLDMKENNKVTKRYTEGN